MRYLYTSTIDVYFSEDRGKRCQSGDRSYWIGLHDMNEESSFIWESTGQQADFTYWIPGQPDNTGRAEDCVNMHDRSYAYKWNDMPCTSCLMPLCEYKKD